jgi:hypothetical protein
MESDENKKEPSWEYRKNFKFLDHLKQVIGLSKEATELEIEQLKKKLDKLTYGG